MRSPRAPNGVYKETVLYKGVTTSNGNAGGTTLIDTGLTQANNYWINLVILILSGNSNNQVRRISTFMLATNTITVDTAFASQILSGTSFVILSQHSPSSGGDATLANQTDILADIGNASSSTLGSLYGILGNPAAAQDISTRIGYQGATSLADKLTAVRAGYLDNINQAGLLQITSARAGYLDLLAATDNNYSTTAALDFTTEKTVFQIAQDTRYEIKGVSVDMTPFTVGATITFKFYRALAAAGGTYRIAGDTITKVVGTDNPIVEFADWAHYGYTKITAQSNNGGDNAVTVPFTYIQRNME